MRLGLCLLFVSSLVPLSAPAQIDPQPDGIGVYFDLEGTITARTTTQPMESVTAHLLATNLSAPDGISGFEVVWRLEGGVPPYWFTLGCDAEGSFDPWFAAYSCWNIIPWAPAILLVSVQFRVPSPETQVRFFVEPVPKASIPGYPAYATGLDPLDIRPLYVSSGSYDLPVATINGDPPEPASAPTWGAVKALFGQ